MNPAPSPRVNVWLHRYAILTALATLVLIGIGGLVTSHEAGMAVPDWPTSYGYNMFLLPFSMWQGGIFYEHTHRLFASFVGLLTTILMLWLLIAEPRRWLRRLGVLAFCAVVLQGVLGGLRVRLLKDSLGIPHAALAQLFLVLLSSIALFTAPAWSRSPLEPVTDAMAKSWLRKLLVGLTCLLFVQLLIGAGMRHEHAGLAVSTFPLAYGKIWPSTDADALLKINQRSAEAHGSNLITAGHIHLHMTHRFNALLLLFGVGVFWWNLRRLKGTKAVETKLALAWAVMIFLQACLGAATVLSNKAADVATAHVVLGAASLVLGTILTVTAFVRPCEQSQ